MRRPGCGLFLVLLVGLLIWAASRGGPSGSPWHPLDLGEAAGTGTGRKLVALVGRPTACHALLDRAGVRYEALAARNDGPHCGFDDGVRFARGGARRVVFAPRAPATSCAVAAALAMWEWTVVQPAALRSFGTPVATIDQLGSYNCRRIANARSWSEHASANAIDIAGFRLVDGRRISVLADWRHRGPEASFLRAVRTGACPLFATVLSPDYNAAHRDHLHLDQAMRGDLGWRACR